MRSYGVLRCACCGCSHFRPRKMKIDGVLRTVCRECQKAKDDEVRRRYIEENFEKVKEAQRRYAAKRRRRERMLGSGAQ